MLIQTSHNETADAGFFRIIGFVFVALTLMSGGVALALLLQQ